MGASGDPGPGTATTGTVHQHNSQLWLVQALGQVTFSCCRRKNASLLCQHQPRLVKVIGISIAQATSLIDSLGDSFKEDFRQEFENSLLENDGSGVRTFSE